MNKLSYKILVAIDDANRSNSHIDISDLLLKFRNRKHSAVDIDIAVEDLCIQEFLIDHDKRYNAFSGLEITTAGRNAITQYEDFKASSIKSTVALILSVIATAVSLAAFITSVI